jgi:insertion element IS1 protein InsB
MESYVAKKTHERWLWHAIDHKTGTILAYVLGRRQDRMFLKLKRMLKPFGITKFYTDKLKTYDRHLVQEERIISKYKMQKIERKHLTLRTRIKRLQRKTICFSKISPMHDLVIGLYINKYEFHRDIL